LEGWYKASITYEDYDDDYSDARIGFVKYNINKLYHKNTGYCPVCGTEGEEFKKWEDDSVVISCLDLLEKENLEKMSTEEINKFLSSNTCYEMKPGRTILSCPNCGNLFTYIEEESGFIYIDRETDEKQD
jgi:rubrerythrin